MVPLSNTKLERIAVQAIENKAIQYNLITNIPVGDKGISFDGDIDVMKDDSEKKESLLGKVPVQVKGTFSENFSERKRTFSIKLAHLRNFYDRNGVVLFVVEINGDLETKIFYKQLLPAELRFLIHKYGKQQSKSLELRPLEETTLNSVCRKFLDESKKQPPILLENNPFKQDEFTNLRLTSLTFNPLNKETSNIFDHDFTVYGVMKELTIPLGIVRIESEIQNGRETILFEGKSIEVDLEIRRNRKNEVTILFDDSLELKLDVNSKFQFNLVKFKSIATQLKILPVLKAILTGKRVILVEQNSYIDGGKPHDEKWIGRIEELYQLFLRLQKAFEVLKLDEHSEFKMEGNKFIKELAAFTRMVLDKDFSEVKMENPQDTCFVLFDLGGLKFILFYEPESTTPLISGFSKDLLEKEFQLEADGEFYQCTAPYFTLTTEALAYSENIDFTSLKSSFDQFECFGNEALFNITNQFVLLCIGAYDLSTNEEFLHLSNYIYSKYKTGLSSHSETIIRINQLQIRYRLNGTLTKKDKDELMKIKITSIDNNQVQFCASVLLGSKTEAEWFFSKMTNEEQKYFMTLPIYHLFEIL